VLVQRAISDGIVSRRPASGRLSGILSGALLALACCAAFAADDVPLLQPGVTLEKHLNGGEAQRFQVRVDAGQFLYVIVEQDGIDVRATLLGPDGKEIAHSDSQNSSWGPELLLVIAAAGGTYGVEVRSESKDDPPGRYEIRIAALREAIARDSERVTAARNFQEGDDQFVQHTAASFAAAIEHYQLALAFYHADGDHYREALALYSIGVTYAQSSEFRSALEYCAPAVPLFHSLGDVRMESATLNFMGGAKDVLGDLQEALQDYNQALPMLRSIKEVSTQASVLNNIGKIYGDLGDWQKSIDYYQEALPLLEALGDVSRQAVTIHNIGVTYDLLGELDEGLQYFQKALPLRRTAGDKDGEAETLTEIGYTYSKLGDAQKAIAYYDQALPLRQAAENHWGQAQTLDHLGVAYASLSQPQKALPYHQQALQIYKDVGDRRDEAVVLRNLGRAYAVLGEPEQDINYQNQALSIFKTIGDRDGAAGALQDLSRAEASRNQLSEACHHIEESLSLIEQIRSGAGSQQQRASYFATQQSAYELDVDLLMLLHHQNPNQGYGARALEASERARARSLLEMLSEAHVDFRAGVDPALLQREHELANSIDAKANRLLSAEGGLTQDEAADLKKQIGDLEMQYQQLEGEIREKSPRYAALTQPQPLSWHDLQQTLDSDTALLEYAIGTDRGYLWMLTASELKSYELPKRSEIENAVRQLYERVTARSSHPRGELPDQRATRIAQADAELPAAAQALSEMVLGPAASELKSKRLVIVADGSLQHVPFSMLPVAGENSATVPLVVAHEIVELPSASTIAALRQELQGREPAPRLLAVIADPVFDAEDPRVKAKSRDTAKTRPQTTAARGDGARILEHLADDSTLHVAAARLVIPRLPYTRQEAERILQAARGSEDFEALDFRASLATATSAELGRYRYLHFATHGYLDSEHPELSAIVLSLVDQNGNSEPGFLRASDIYNLKLPAELVVLSACQTGLGKEIRGEGIVGLTRGFMYAGAARVDVSLWSVNDKATEELMAVFYEKLLQEKMTPAAALREAQIEMHQKKQWANPYYWAAFVQQGEWR